MVETFKLIIENQNGYFAGGWQYPIFALALVALLFIFKNRAAWVFFVYTIAALFVIYCPITAKIVMAAVGDDVYYRMFWILPILPVLGVFMVEAFPAFCELGKRYLSRADYRLTKTVASFFLISVFAVGLMAGGHLVYEKGVIGRAHNLEKLPDEVIDVCDFINSDYEADPVGVKKVAAVGTIVPYIRQYDATILQVYGRNTAYKGDHTKGRGKLYLELTFEENPDYDYIEEMLKKTKSTYLVISDSAYVSASEMEKRGCKNIYDNGAYTVLKVI